MGFAQLGREEALYQGAYHAYADNEIGRVIQAVEDLGELDNTLIIYIGGDNGASAEGMLNGMPNELTTFNGVAAGQGPVSLVSVLGIGTDVPAFCGRLGVGAHLCSPWRDQRVPAAVAVVSTTSKSWVIVAVLAIIADAEQYFSTESEMARSTFSAASPRPFTTKCM
jgi:hypothetical protein